MKLNVFLFLLLVAPMANSQISYPPTSATPSGPAGGNLSGTYPNPTVVKINGTALSGLATGLLKNTTATGVPSIAVAGTDLIGGVGNLTTVGAVPYVSASGILNQDPTAFFWDATNDRLGIGTTAPSTYLNVRGASTDTVNFHDTTPIAANIGAGLLLGGNYLGTTVTTWAAVQSGKNNATSGDYGGYLGLWTRANGSPNSEKMRITSTGNVGIGTTTPAAPLTVGTAVGSPATNANAVIINAANTTLSSRGGNLQVITTDSSAVDVGGSIGLGGQYNTLANSVEFASIAGRKENSTVTNFAGYLQFITTADAVAPTEKMRITSAGNVGIGTTSPGVKLDVLGSARVYSSTADAAILLGSDQVDANSGKISYNRGTANLDITPRSTYATNLVGKLKFSITNSTAAGSALLGANSPATILTAPYTWITVITSDGTTGFMPIWK